MGQLLSTFGINWQLLLVQAVNFSLLLVLLWYFLYRPMARILDARRQTIERGIAEAKKAHEERRAAENERKEMLAHAARESESIIGASRERAATTADEIVHAASARAEGLLSDAAARAEELARRAMKESEKGIARAVVLATEKVLHERASHT